VYNKHNGANQKWTILYVDDKEDTRTKGTNDDFGLKINEPFYIVSRLPFHRVAELIGARNIVLKR